MPLRYKPGYAPDPYVICDICGFQNRRSQTAMMWNGLRACTSTCWDRKPVNDNPPPMKKKEGLALPQSRPESTDVFIDPTLPPNTDDL